jgi:uncharacterized protein (DUF58 family)
MRDAEQGRVTRRRMDLTWVPSPLARRIVTMAASAVAVAGLLVRPALVAFAVPALLALAWWVRELRPDRVLVEVEAATPRVLEGQPVELVVRARLAPEDAAVPDEADRTVGSWRLAWRPDPFVDTDDRVLTSLGSRAEARREVTPTRWGFWSSGSAVVGVSTPRRMWSADVVSAGPSLTVYPPAAAALDGPPPPNLRALLGPHVSRLPAAGIEFAGVRPYLPGDPMRRVNWSVTSRLDTLMINEFAQERLADVVVLIDSVHDAGTPGRTTVDISVRGAASVVQTYLTTQDRVGVVAFGSMLRWLTPTSGVRQFYRIIETLLQARQARTYVDPSLDRLPLAALPAGALVVCFSPLLDDIVVEALRELRQRAHPVVVVDVLTEQEVPRPDGIGELGLRIWRLEREALTTSLERIGVRVVPHADVTGGSLGWLRLPAGAAR